jgi:hypothetical protein
MKRRKDVQALGQRDRAEGPTRARRGGAPSAVASRLFVVAAGLSALGLAGASGCGESADSLDTQGAPLGEARQAVSTPTSCLAVRRGGGGKVRDAQIAHEKVNTNYGSSSFALVSGGTATNPPHPQQMLLHFDLSAIPHDATVLNAGLNLNQTNNGAVTANVHEVLAPWDEATVTWNSFGGAFDAAVVKSFSTATANVSVDILPLVKGWVDGSRPNLGVLIEAPGAAKTTFKASEFGIAAQRPFLTLCYNVVCAPGFADCDNLAATGCEVDLGAPASCGACGNVCSLPHATAGCAAAQCVVASCDLGWGDCDGVAQNGCETDLSSDADCGACGVACSLPGAVASCASGTCTTVSCNGGFFDCDGDALDGCEPSPCADGAHCGAAGDCASAVCAGGFCASPACNDAVQNGGESAVDCGGPGCPGCADGLACALGADCQSGVCEAGICGVPTCSDAKKNGAESAVDCGGGSCPPCPDAAACALGADCQSGVCLGGVCQAPACGDGLKNGAETGVDCGGPCAACADGAGCLVASDCVSLVCTAGVCQLPSCADGVKNGSEPDVDCGGSCAPCSSNAACSAPSDCASGVCAGGHCQPPSCNDGVKNGDETGLDCGGACAIPEVCNGVDDDCDGSTDEGLGSTTCGIGACQVTVQSCVGGAAQSCVPGAPSAEVCDGALDDDCDGTVDDGCECVNGATQGCYSGSGATANVGACHGGVQTCVLGHWGACAGEVTPKAETCNGVDDDCNGGTDEGLGSTICGVGACQALVQNCVNGAPVACAPGSPSAEICDGEDNDCDGQVDEDQPTVSCGVGACAVTIPSCVNGILRACDPHLSDGAACNDGKVCTVSDACFNGACTGANAPAGTLCRASAGACDPAESCTGSSPECPADSLSPAGVVCRASGGVCDLQETCNGSSAACPADSFAPASTVCRAAVAGGCDVAESCTGASAACPGDSFAPAGTVCRAASGVCDGAETCTGGSSVCPNNTSLPAGNWTLVTSAVAPTIAGGANKQYLYVAPNGRWYQSPVTTQSWNWGFYQALNGTYTYCNGTSVGSFGCNSAEGGHFGIGCSNGPGGTFKTLPIYSASPGAGQCEVCQDQPNAFGGGVCQLNVSIYFRYVP